MSVLVDVRLVLERWIALGILPVGFGVIIAEHILSSNESTPYKVCFSLFIFSLPCVCVEALGCGIESMLISSIG